MGMHRRGFEGQETTGRIQGERPESEAGHTLLLGLTL